MRFLILGSGMQGKAIAFDLLRNPQVKEVLLADASAAGLAQAKGYLKSNRLRLARADAADLAKVRQLAQGRDVLISAVPYFLNLGLAKAAIAAKAHFVDLGGNTNIVWRELALDARAKRAGVTLLPDVGLGPGMTTTLARHGIAQLDEAHEVYIRDGGLPQDPVPPMNYLLTFSEHGLINEYVEQATALRNGRRVEVPGLSEVETLEFPSPLGRLEAAHAAGGLSTMAWTYAGKVKTMDCKLLRYPGHIAVINAMNALGFFSTRKLRWGASAKPAPGAAPTLSPREMSARLFREHFARPGEKDLVVIRVTVKGVKNGRPAEVVHELLDRYDEKNRMTAMARTTGFPASIVAQMLASGAIRKPGAYPVELGIPPEPFLAEARKRGFNLSWRLKTLPEPIPVV